MGRANKIRKSQRIAHAPTASPAYARGHALARAHRARAPLPCDALGDVSRSLWARPPQCCRRWKTPSAPTADGLRRTMVDRGPTSSADGQSGRRSETNKDARNECTAVRDALAGLQQCEPPVHGLAGARRGLIGSTRELPPPVVRRLSTPRPTSGRLGNQEPARIRCPRHSWKQAANMVLGKNCFASCCFFVMRYLALHPHDSSNTPCAGRHRGWEFGITTTMLAYLRRVSQVAYAQRTHSTLDLCLQSSVHNDACSPPAHHAHN